MIIGKYITKILHGFVLAIAGTTIFSCQQKEELTAVSSSLPFDTITTIPANNPLTTEKITLGKKLFFDTYLSSNKQVSCATCHLPNKAFTDGTQLSPLGVTGQNQTRNAPAIFNLVYHKAFFWDGGKETLENQAFGPLRNEHEMNANFDSLLAYLNNNTEYATLFQDAFQEKASSSNLVKAIASFERSLLSFDSKWDHVINGTQSFTSKELEGQKIFEQNCKSCHTPPLFTDLSFHNNGLDSIYGTEFDDHKNGRYRITSDSSDLGKFKTPSLRNLAFTSPYMHDGRLSTIEDVLNHYNSPIQSTTLDTTLINGIQLTELEKNQLLEFLKTLNDENFINQN